MSESRLVQHREIRIASRGEGEMHDVTETVADILGDSGVTDGLVNVFVPGSTGGVTTIEFEPGLKQDFPEAMDRLAPRNIPYAHDATWHDGNGHSHVRASLLGPSLTVPAAGGRLVLGTWQQIILVDFDNKPRDRRLVVTVMGV
jgi:secondary thiamine-phosphate synthase enzyme